MPRPTHWAATAAIVTALTSVGAVTPAHARTAEPHRAAATAATQADEERMECVRENRIAGARVRSVLCLRYTWDASTGVSTLVTRLKIVNGTRTNRSLLVRLASHRGDYRAGEVYQRSMPPAGEVVYRLTRRVERRLAHPLAKSRVSLYDFRTDDFTLHGKTLRATP